MAMDHSQHSIHDHDHHAMPTVGTSGHIHDISMDTTTPSEIIHHDHSLHITKTEDIMGHMMSMAFHFGYNETILFSQWNISTIAGLIGSMLVIFLMAVLYEGLKYYREYLFWKSYNLLEYRPVSTPDKGTEDQRPGAPTVHYVGEVIHKQPPTMFCFNHIYQTILHIFQVTLSFLLMLIFMTYNVWLCIAVVMGAAVGYFLFCWKKSVIVDVTEHCH